MIYPLATKLIASCALFFWAGLVLGHEGHSLDDAHWHTTDTFGLLAVAGLAALAVIASLRGK